MGGTICRIRDPNQISRSPIPLPWIVVNRFLRAIEYAEKILGKPANVCHIFHVLKEKFNLPVSIYMAAALMNSIFREDLIFCDLIMSSWTVNKQEGYLNYSDWFRLKYQADGYVCDSLGTVVPSTARTISYTELRSFFVNKD